MANEHRSSTFVNCLGEEKTLLSLPGADDAIGIVLLKRAGLPHDDALVRFDTLAALLAAHPECDFTGYTDYGRFWSTTPPTITVDKTNNRLLITGREAILTAAGGATNNDVGKLIWVYRPTAGALDSAIRPVQQYRCELTTDGTTRVVSVNAAGSLEIRSLIVT